MPDTATLHRSDGATLQRVQHAAAGTALLIALAYLLIYAGVLSVGRAEDGELGVLGVAGVVFLGLAAALWRLRSRVLWSATAVLQVLLALMYVAVAVDRDPAYEVWGLTIRALSFVLFAGVVYLLVRSRRGSGTA